MTRFERVGPYVACMLVVVVLVSGHPSLAQERPPTATITYNLKPLEGVDDNTLRTRFTRKELSVFEVLNRADAVRLAQQPLLVVPLHWHADIIAYSPFPLRYERWGGSYPKLLVVDQMAQAFAAYEVSTLVRWGPISSGRRTLQTPAGLFHLNWRSRGRHSTVDPDWYMPWYFNFHNTRGLSFHQYDLPGRPASHACIRLLERDARWLFEWGETWTLDERGWNVLDPGTPVLILNCYDFDQPPPWRSLEWLARGVELPASPNLSIRECPTQ